MLLGVDIVAVHNRKCNIGAVVGNSLEIGEQIAVNEAGDDSTAVLRYALYVIRFEQLGHLVDYFF